jgi:hypothetical protein
MRLNSRFGENHRIIEFLVPNSRKNAASAIAASAQVRFVRIADIYVFSFEGPLCSLSFESERYSPHAYHGDDIAF